MRSTNSAKASEAFPVLETMDPARRHAILLRGRHWRMCLRDIARPAADPHLAAVGSSASFALGPIALAKSTISSCHLVRDARMAREGAFAQHVMLVLMIRGSLRGHADGRNIDLGRGDAGFLDLSREGSMEASDASMLSLLAPRDILRGSVHGLVLRESQLPCRMLTRHLEQLILSLPSTDPARIDAMAHAALAVVQLCVDFAPTPEPADAIDEVRDAILAYIDENLDDTSLTPEMLGARFHVSRTWLYRIFSGFGGIKRCIRDKRLDAAFHDLCSAPHQRIIDIAYRRGFSSERQFQRAFLARFGMTPSSVKEGQGTASRRH